MDGTTEVEGVKWNKRSVDLTDSKRLVLGTEEPLHRLEKSFFKRERGGRSEGL